MLRRLRRGAAHPRFPARDLHREAPLNIRILTEPPGGSRLVRDYLAGEGSAAAFYNGHPLDPAAFRAKWEAVRRRFGRAERERAAEALRPTSAAAAERLARWVAEGGAVVTTGQQAGLFTGPLYTVHKILSAIRLAEALERELEVAVLPVFWTASEDHDWAEVNHADLVDARGDLRRIRLPGEPAVPLPMSEHRVGEGVESAVAALALALDGQPFADDLLTRVRAAYRPDATVAGAFRETIQALFARFDLLVTDAADPTVKRASAPVLEGAIRHARAHEALLRRRTDDLLRAGYHGQVAIVPDAANVFFHGPAGRERLQVDGDGWVARGARRAFTPEELHAAVEADPGSFSPNVFLRPVVESAVFPTLAYVGGPAEIGYFAQLNPLFREFGMEPPVAFPRFSVTLLPPRAERALDRLGLSLTDLDRPEHQLVSRLARERVPAEVTEALRGVREALAESYARLIDSAQSIDPTLRGALGSLRNRSMLSAADAERKIVSAVARRSGEVTGEICRARAELRPRGQPQERVLNVLPYLAAYGPGLLSEIAARMEIRFRTEDQASEAREQPLTEPV